MPETRRIMVVDDEPLIADTLAVILRTSGYQAAPYYDGRSALEACRLSPPNLLLSDVTMPGLNGIDLAILIRKLCPTCRILLFSGLSASFDLVHQAKRDGHHFEILEKPVHPPYLLERIQATLNDPPGRPFPSRRTGT